MNTRFVYSILIYISILCFSCNTSPLHVDNDDTSDIFTLEENIDISFLKYADTARWQKTDVVKLYMLHPIIKINMSKTNDMKYIYKQFDSAVAFAKMIGYNNAIFNASFTLFGTEYYSDYEQIINGYLDTAKWIPRADQYLRDRSFMGITNMPEETDVFIPFHSDDDYYRFIGQLKTDSIVYLIFNIERIANFTNVSQKKDAYPTYGGGKIMESSWELRQTKPYPRRD